jgi:hypothetical protein
MEFKLFLIRSWLQARRIEQYHHWVGLQLRDRFDLLPCRDCDVPEGMWW